MPNNVLFFLHLLIMWWTISYLSTYTCYSVAYYWFFEHNWSLWCYCLLVLLSFSFENPLAKPCTGFLVCNLANLSHKLSIRLFFFTFSFSVFFVVFSVYLMLRLLLLDITVTLSLCFLMYSSSLSFDSSTQSLMLACPLLPFFLYSYSLRMLSLGCKILRIVNNFLGLWSICLSFSLLKMTLCILQRKLPCCLFFSWSFWC